MNHPASIKRIETSVGQSAKLCKREVWMTPPLLRGLKPWSMDAIFPVPFWFECPASIKRIETQVRIVLPPSGTLTVWITPPLLRGLKLESRVSCRDNHAPCMNHLASIKRIETWCIWVNAIGLHPGMNDPASIKRIETIHCFAQDWSVKV